MSKTAASPDELIRDHYRQQAEKHGASSRSTMEDEIIRGRELEFIDKFLGTAGRALRKKALKVLDLGCGNGYALELAHRSHPRNRYWGLDFSEDLLALARGRELPHCDLRSGDARALPYQQGFFDVVYTERCLINLLDPREQEKALGEIHRVLKPGGYYLMIEAFADGLENNNRARRELGLTDVPEAYHNKFFDKERFLAVVKSHFEVVEPESLDRYARGYSFCSNFLSSHYFISRVLYPAVLKGELVRNSEFIKFFTFLPPIGNYASVQAYVLKKKGRSKSR
ncbi:MAG TPA: class I SAM-dependent methyltransferase [Terriglobales bacterium]|jgi:ubiquinone/menaquinone biosynthesis C-methylase UbiE|nr:class I SAM-dependent methyltransferase [Terriglobales bacterium]